MKRQSGSQIVLCCALASAIPAGAASGQLYEFTFFGTVTDVSRDITPGNPLEELTQGMSTTLSFTIDSTVSPSFTDATGSLWFDPDIYAAMSFSSTPINFSRSGSDVEGAFGILDNATANFPGMYQDAITVGMLTENQPIDFFSFQLESITDTPSDFIDGLDIPDTMDVTNATVARYGVSNGSAFRLIQIDDVEINLVPAPASVSAIAFGAICFARRRR